MGNASQCLCGCERLVVNSGKMFPAILWRLWAMKGKLVQPQAAAYSTRVIHYLCTSPGRPRRPERTPSPRRRCWGSDRAHSRPWWECSGRNARCSRRRRAAATGRSMPRSSGSQQHGRAGVKRWSRLWLGSGEIAPG